MRCGTGKLSEEQFKALWATAEAEEAARAAAMPTEQDAINAMFSAHLRLRDLGWREAIYCPKDGSEFDVIEAGSTGIHRCHYSGEWPDGHWWVADDGDLWPSRPVLYRPTEAEKARWAELREAFTGLAPPCDSGRHAERENSRSEVEAEGCQSGGAAASPKSGAS